jgi:hypothetical protein
MNKIQYVMEVWEQKEVKREKISTKVSPYPFPFYPVGTKYIFGNNPFTIIDSTVKHETVKEEINSIEIDDNLMETKREQGYEWIDVHKHIIVVSK